MVYRGGKEDGHWRSVHRGGIVGSLIQFVAVRVGETMLPTYTIFPFRAMRRGRHARCPIEAQAAAIGPTCRQPHQRVLGMRCEDARLTWPISPPGAARGGLPRPAPLRTDSSFLQCRQGWRGKNDAEAEAKRRRAAQRLATRE